jgi:intein/homing endonuclease
MVVTNCDYCNKKIEREKYKINASGHHFCNKKCYGKWKEYPIKLEPTYALGYLIGVIFGDGNINTSTHQIIITTADIDWIGTLITIINEICPDISAIGIYSYEYWGKAVHVNIYSKKLCDILKPFKPKPHRYYIPNFLNTPDSLAGFIAGLIDTDGYIQIHKKSSAIILTSKYADNLTPIKKTLEDTFGISSKVYTPPSRCSSILKISGYLNLFQFENNIGLIMMRRQILLHEVVIEMSKKYKRANFRKQRMEKMISLYKKGVPLKQIAEQLQISKDYIYILMGRKNICIRRRARYTSEQYYDVIKLREAGCGINKLILHFPDINHYALSDWIYRDRKPFSVHRLDK